jgi:hypothetical protein
MCRYVGLLFLLPWRWRRHVPPKRRFTINPHATTFQKMIADLSSLVWFRTLHRDSVMQTICHKYKYSKMHGVNGLLSWPFMCFDVLFLCVIHVLYNISWLIRYNCCRYFDSELCGCRLYFRGLAILCSESYSVMPQTLWATEIIRLCNQYAIAFLYVYL